MFRLKSNHIIFLFLFFFVSSYAEQADKIAKSFSGKTIDGKEIKLSDFKNKVILLDFWASWCLPCRKEMPELIKFYDKHKKEGFIIIGVNIDDHSENIKKFIDKLSPKPNFPILWDPNKEIPAKYNIEAMPTTIFIDKTGKERFRHNGFKANYIEDFENEFNLLK